MLKRADHNPLLPLRAENRGPDTDTQHKGPGTPLLLIAGARSPREGATSGVAEMAMMRRWRLSRVKPNRTVVAEWSSAQQEQ